MQRKLPKSLLPIVSILTGIYALCHTIITALPLSSQTIGAIGAFLSSPVSTLQIITQTQMETPVFAPTAPVSPNQNSASAVSPASPPIKEPPATSPPVQPALLGDEPLEPRPPVPQEEIPDGMTPLLEQHFVSHEGPRFIRTGNALIRNVTNLEDQIVAEQVRKPLPFQIQLNSSEPQVLIMHTHATESYESEEHNYSDPNYTSRTTDPASNMIAIGTEITAILNAQGIHTLHDQTLHDYPSYNGSYEKSKQTVQNYLQQYPSIRVVIDVHRDAIQRPDGTKVKPVVTINGEKSAQVMLICGADRGGNLPNYTQNLTFAANWQAQMEQTATGLTRPVLFDYRYYNQDLTTGSLLLEVGGHGNTLQEAKVAARYAAQALANTLKANALP